MLCTKGSSQSPPPSPCSHHSSLASLNAMKIKTMVHNAVFSHICRFFRSLSKLKSLLLELCNKTRVMYFKNSCSELRRRKKKMNKYRQKILFGSFRLHYNWCSSSHVIPIHYNYYSASSSSACPRTEEAGYGSSSNASYYYDSTWNSVFSTNGDDDRNGVFEGKSTGGGINDESSQLSSYLEWLEEKGNKKKDESEIENEVNEIDLLADMFIANCHEKFRLEKIESYRRYQEMLARGM